MNIDSANMVCSNARPGTASIIKRRKSIKIEDKEIVSSDYCIFILIWLIKQEEQRLSTLYKLLTRLRELESDRNVSLSTKSSMGSHQTWKSYNSAARAYIDPLIFKPVKENQVRVLNDDYLIFRWFIQHLLH